jgi:hypothetical protein
MGISQPRPEIFDCPAQDGTALKAGKIVAQQRGKFVETREREEE